MLAKRWGTEHESVVPYKAFRTADGYLTLGTGNEAQFRSFCERIGVPELADDDRFADNARRVANRKQLYEIIDPVLASKTNAYWTQVFDGSSFPVGPVNNMAQVSDRCSAKVLELFTGFTGDFVRGDRTTAYYRGHHHEDRRLRFENIYIFFPSISI